MAEMKLLLSFVIAFGIAPALAREPGAKP